MRWQYPAVVLLVGCAATPRPVDQGLIRSSTLKPTQLEAALKQDHVRTVINARGFAPNDPDYVAEVEACRRLNVRHVDVALGPGPPDREEVIRLLEVFRTSEKPILIHGPPSQGGVGFVSGLYRLTERHQEIRDARKELPPFRIDPIVGQQAARYDQFFANWRGVDDFYAHYQLPKNAKSGSMTDAGSTSRGAVRESREDPRSTVRLGTPRSPSAMGRDP